MKIYQIRTRLSIVESCRNRYDLFFAIREAGAEVMVPRQFSRWDTPTYWEVVAHGQVIGKVYTALEYISGFLSSQVYSLDCSQRGIESVLEYRAELKAVRVAWLRSCEERQRKLHRQPSPQQRQLDEARYTGGRTVRQWMNWATAL